MAILVTGASGFLGKVVTEKLLEKGHKVYGLSRHPPAPQEKLVPLEGDILKIDFGLQKVPRDIHAVHHLAAIHTLGDDPDGLMWQTNVEGTGNVIDFCRQEKIPHLYFCSTAYTEGRNVYERSKALCEEMVTDSGIRRVSIFKPSVIMGTAEHPYPGHFSQVVSLIIKIHQRAEIIRRKIEGTLRLPVIEPVFRMRGNPEGRFNMVTVDRVALVMTLLDEPGTYWLTNPCPPTLKEVLEWIGEFLLINIKIMPDFKPTPIEAQFLKVAASFQPYLQGDDFPSDMPEGRITREFIHDTIRRSLA